MTKAEIKKRLTEYKTYRRFNGVTKELYSAWCLAVEMADDMKDAEFVIEVGKDALDVIEGYILREANASFAQLEEHAQAEKKKFVILERYYGVLRIMGKYDLDSFCLYVERHRLRKDRFYEPRRERLKLFADAITDLEYDRLDELYLHCPPRIGKSQLVTMACAWHCARNDELSNLYVTYVNSLGGAFMNGVLEIIRDPTYAFEDVFPNEQVANTDSTAHKMNLGRFKKYATLSGKGMDAALNGEYDASGWLILDDLHEGIQEVLNPDLMARKQAIFDNNVITRKKMGCKILGIGTLWSVNDIYSDRQDFLSSNPKAKDIRWKVFKIPALNEKEESNFDYKFGVGFNTQYYLTLRDKFESNDDSASWAAQFMQEPVERSGVLFDSANMKYYNGVLPNEEPIRITFACDVALGGEDYLAMPIAYVYEDGSVYIHDVVYDNAEKKYTKPKVVTKIIQNNAGSGYFEANQGGEGYKDEVDEELKKLNHKINLRSNYAPANKRKEQRIFDKAGSIREYYYRDQTCRDPEYRKFMNNLFNFSMKDKRKHKQDGAPDSLASLAYYLEGTWNTVRAGFNPFRSRRI